MADQKALNYRQETLELLKLESEKTMGLKYMNELKEEGEREMPEGLEDLAEGRVISDDGELEVPPTEKPVPTTQPTLHTLRKHSPSLLGGNWVETIHPADFREQFYTDGYYYWEQLNSLVKWQDEEKVALIPFSKLDIDACMNHDTEFDEKSVLKYKSTKKICMRFSFL